MANKVKVDMNYAKTLIASGANRDTFINEMSSRYNLSKSYAKFLYYKLKNSSSPQVESSPQEAQESPAEEPQKETKIINPNDVTVSSTTPNEEAIDLKKAYSKLFESETGVSPEEISEEGEEEGAENIEGGQAPSSQFGEQAEQQGQANLKIKLGALLKQIGVSINNNILWKERPLDEEEIRNIEEVSNEVELSFGEGLEGPYSPYYNYILFTLAAPIISRVDLLPKKLKDLSEWLGSLRNRPSRPAEQPQVFQQPQQQASGENIPHRENLTEEEGGPAAQQYPTGLSPAQIELINNLKKQGYQVAPDFDPNKPIDYAALKDKIARNVKINF